MLPADATARKGMPIFSGCVCYFPVALAAVAQLSRIGNDQHNPGQPLHWAKEKSTDELDCLLRHATDAAIDPMHRDPDGVLAAVKMAWRALANLQRMHDAGQDIFACESSSVAGSGSSAPRGDDSRKRGDGATQTSEPSCCVERSRAAVISTP